MIDNHLPRSAPYNKKDRIWGDPILPFLAALLALYLPLTLSTHSLADRHFRILTQRTTLETWDYSDIWSEWCLDEKPKRQIDKRRIDKQKREGGGGGHKDCNTWEAFERELKEKPSYPPSTRCTLHVQTTSDDSVQQTGSITRCFTRYAFQVLIYEKLLMEWNVMYHNVLQVAFLSWTTIWRFCKLCDCGAEF